MDNLVSNLNIYCVTDKKIQKIKHSNYFIGWVGKENPPQNYLRCDLGNHIFGKEKFYSELTFHYWYWKNKLDEDQAEWIGFCQKRRFWLKEKKNKFNINYQNIEENLLHEVPTAWKNYDAIICEPIYLNKVKKMKLLKRGFKSLIKNPSIFFNKNLRNIKLHFDMHHGYGNLEKAINLLDKSESEKFNNYVVNNVKYNPHIMFIAKKNIIKNWFNELFKWLDDCEKEFGFENLKGYDTGRLYAYLAERYLSFWFKQNTKYLEWPWTLIDD